MMTHLGNMQAAQQRTLPSPFDPSSEPGKLRRAIASDHKLDFQAHKSCCKDHP